MGLQQLLDNQNQAPSILQPKQVDPNDLFQKLKLYLQMMNQNNRQDTGPNIQEMQDDSPKQAPHPASVWLKPIA